MKFRNTFIPSICLLVSFCGLVDLATSQTTLTDTERFHGRWHLIDYQQQDSAGQWQWMEIGLKGSIMYDGNGGMGVHQIPKDYEEYEFEGKGSRENLTENDLRHIANNFVYFGGYKVDTANKLVEHHIETHIRPGRNGTIASRYYHFSGDTLFLSPVDRDPPLRIVWLRVYESPQNRLSDRITFADQETSSNLMTQTDAFTESWSAFDIHARLHKTDGTRSELMTYIGEQALTWTEKEKYLLRKAFHSIEKDLDQVQFTIDFPDEIYMVKSTSNEEGSAVAYTRSNYIVFQDGLDLHDTWNVKRLLLHELFHVISRSNPEFRKRMYRIIGFRIANSIDYPESIEDLRITNPDAPQTDSYIRLFAEGDSVDCMMILYSKEPYDGTGEFFDYLNIGFLALEGDEIKRPATVEGKPVIYEMGQVQGFFEQVGNNTGYIVHPEEIMADNFSYAVTSKEGLMDPWIVEHIIDFLRK